MIMIVMMKLLKLTKMILIMNIWGYMQIEELVENLPIEDLNSN